MYSLLSVRTMNSSAFFLSILRTVLISTNPFKVRGSTHETSYFHFRAWRTRTRKLSELAREMHKDGRKPVIFSITVMIYSTLG